MTQALVNNLDVLSKTVSDTGNQKSVNSAAVVSDEKTSDKFNQILDKTIDKKSCTLGDMKNGDMTNKTENIANVLIQATREASMEKSLDLTLAREIANIINQLKPAVNTVVSESDEDTDSLETEESCISDDTILTEEDAEITKQNDTEIEITTDIQPVFEQVLSIVSTIKPEVQTGLTETVVNEQNVEIAPQKSSGLNIMPNVNKEESAEDEIDLTQKLDEDMLDELNVEVLDSETDSQAGENTAQQESPEEVGIKVMLNNSNEKTNIQFEKQINLNTTKPAEITSEKIIEQITKHFDSLKTSSKLTMTLNPENLGKVNLQILNSKDGLSAQFTVMTNDARELIMKGLDGLKEALLTHGVNVDNISVKVSDTKEPYNPDWTEQENSENNSNEQQKQKHEERKKGLFEKTMAESLDKENGNV